MADAAQGRLPMKTGDYGLRDADALRVVMDEAPPACHPGEGSLDDPLPRQELEPLLVLHRRTRIRTG